MAAKTMEAKTIEAKTMHEGGPGMRAIHQHDADATSTEIRGVSVALSPWLALRVLLTVAAAVLLLVGSFLEWAGGSDGTELAVQSYWLTDAGTAGFFSSAGLVTAIAGAVIILGLAFRSGWITRFAGAVALVAFTLVVIQMGRGGSLDSLQDIGMGMWLILLGGVIALIGGFFPATRMVATSTTSTDTEADEATRSLTT